MILLPNIEDQKGNKWKQEEDQEGSFKEDSWGVKDGTEGRLGRRLPVERIPEIGRIFRFKKNGSKYRAQPKTLLFSQPAG